MPKYKAHPHEETILTPFDTSSYDAAVEADGPDEQWQPEQHGNVVVVEPDLMFQHRRGKL